MTCYRQSIVKQQNVNGQLVSAMPQECLRKGAIWNTKLLLGTNGIQTIINPILQPKKSFKEHGGRKMTRITAMVVPPALIKAAQTAVVRGLPGRLMLQAARRGGFSFAPALNNVLLLYSIGISIWAAWKTVQSNVPNSPNVGHASASNEHPDEMYSASTEPKTLLSSEDACPLCGGKGSITYEAKFLWRDSPCPLCLGKGRVSKRKSDTLRFQGQDW